MDKSSDEKELVGREAVVRFLSSGARVGFGTGSTAVWSIREIGERLRAGTVDRIVGVATSFQSELECRLYEIPVRSMNDPELDGSVDIVFDGADEVVLTDGKPGALIKGGGAALLIEKVVAYNASKLVIVATRNKVVPHIGTGFPIPVEVVPLARIPVEQALRRLGADPVLRMAQRKMGPVITDNGNMIFDVTFPEPVDPEAMETTLSEIPGVMANGIFCRRPVTLVTTDESGDVRIYE